MFRVSLVERKYDKSKEYMRKREIEGLAVQTLPALPAI